MHELSLFAQVPAAQHAQLLQILAGICVMPPIPFTTHTLIFKPHSAPTQSSGANAKAPTVGASQDVVDTAKAARRARKMQVEKKDAYFVTCVATITEDEESAWELRFDDVPDATKKDVTARPVQRTSLPSSDVLAYMEGNEHSLVDAYALQGHCLVHRNVVLHLQRVLRRGPGDSTPVERLPPLEKMVPLDSSGAYLLQASVMVLDGDKQELMVRASKELLQLKETLRGVLDLKPAERLTLDTRIKKL